MSRAEIHVTAAKEVAEFLDGIGERKRANDVRNVIKSLSVARSTMSILHKDNMKLREVIAP